MRPSRPPSSATGAPSTSPPFWAAIPRRSARAATTWNNSLTGSTEGSVKKGRAEEVHRCDPAPGGELPPGAAGSHGGRPDAAGGPLDRPDLRTDRRAPGRGGHAGQRAGGQATAQEARLRDPQGSEVQGD